MSNPQDPGQQYGGYDGYGQGQDYGQGAGQPYGQAPQYGAEQYGGEQYGAEQYGGEQYGQGYGQEYAAYDAGYGQGGDYGQAPGYGQADAQYGYADPGQPGAYAANPYQGAAQSHEQPSGLLAILSLAAGIIALLTCAFIPWVGLLLGGLFVLAAIVLGIMALVMKRFGAKKALAVAGLVLGGISAVAGIANPFVWTAITTPQTHMADVEVRFSSSDASTGDVDVYMTNGIYSTDASFDEDFNLYDEPMPYSQTFQVAYREDSSPVYFSVSAMSGEGVYDAEYTCEILVNGEVVASETSTYAWCSYTEKLQDQIGG